MQTAELDLTSPPSLPARGLRGVPHVSLFTYGKRNYFGKASFLLPSDIQFSERLLSLLVFIIQN
jgi:hypothetical protein